MSNRPLVSVVTPFYNTAGYLRECIESVLAQTHTNFEYLLVDNQSTDGSELIAAEYAARDTRIRLLRNETFVGQVANYNGALRHVSSAAQYIKLVQADDCIFPECLERMVAVGESHSSVAIISSYYLTGATVCGSGIDWPQECVPGKLANRLHLLEGRFVFGTPTTLMYRAELLKQRQPFYSEGSLHEDSELCHEVLATTDLGFVHQVLSYNRVGNGILAAIDNFQWQILDFYIVLRKCGPLSLTPVELERRIRKIRGEYLRLLGESAVLRREPEFWAYHRRGLASVGESLPSWIALTPHVGRAVIKTLVRPQWFLRERSRLRKAHSHARTAAHSSAVRANE